MQEYLRSLDELHDVAIGFGDGRSGEATPPELASEHRQLGDFRIIREVGRGGMGVVYEAEQISLGRRVALKVLPFASVLDARQIARFTHEAKAAAQLLHPNIVPVFAVGVDRGVHFYAMRFIEGQPLDRAIGELQRGNASTVGQSPSITKDYESQASHDNEPDAGNRLVEGEPGVAPLLASKSTSYLTNHAGKLTEYLHAIIQLGIQAAEALHAAHEQGIVHRDVKPSNLMVDDQGKLWVTDFGLARCQTDAALTRTGDVIGTARYMSPEQALGQSALVDHRSDIYSLGVTLYELLTLRPAFAGDDGPALLQQIATDEPRRLRQIEPRIPVDLETVVLKAMAKRREERYDDAQQLADDLQRVLDGRPTIARPPTVAERCTKWAARHKRLVASIAGVGLLTLVGLTISTTLIARDAVDRFGIQLSERLAKVPGAESVRRDVLQETLQYYRKFAAETKNDPTLKVDLALTYSKIGVLASDAGALDEAIDSQRKAIDLFKELAAADPDSREYRQRLALCWNNYGLALRRRGATDRAEKAYREAIRIQSEVLGQQPSAEQLGELALSYSNLGMLQHELGAEQAAESSFTKAVHIEEQLEAQLPNNAERLRRLAATLNNLSALDSGTNPARAAELYARVLAYQQQADRLQPNQPQTQAELASTYNNLAMAQIRAGLNKEAAASCEAAIATQRELVKSAPSRRDYRRDLAISYNNLGLICGKLGSASQAEAAFRKGLALQEALVQQTPKDIESQSALGGIYNNLGMTLEAAARFEDAAAAYATAIEHQNIAYTGAPSIGVYRSFLSKHYYNYGRVLRQLKRGPEAVEAALARRALWTNDPQHLFAVAEELAITSQVLDAMEAKLGGKVSAKQCGELAIETLRHAVAAGWKPGPKQDWMAAFSVVKDQPGFSEILKN